MNGEISHTYAERIRTLRCVTKGIKLKTIQAESLHITP